MINLYGALSNGSETSDGDPFSMVSCLCVPYAYPCVFYAETIMSFWNDGAFCFYVSPWSFWSDFYHFDSFLYASSTFYGLLSVVPPLLFSHILATFKHGPLVFLQSSSKRS